MRVEAFSVMIFNFPPRPAPLRAPAGIKALRVLAHDDEIYVRIVRGICGRFRMGRKFAYSSISGVSATLMLENPPPTGVSQAPSAHASTLDRFDHFFRDVLTILLERIGAHLERLPLKLHTRRFQNAYRRLRYFRPDSSPGINVLYAPFRYSLTTRL